MGAGRWGWRGGGRAVRCGGGRAVRRGSRALRSGRCTGPRRRVARRGDSERRCTDPRRREGWGGAGRTPAPPRDTGSASAPRRPPPAGPSGARPAGGGRGAVEPVRGGRRRRADPTADWGATSWSQNRWYRVRRACSSRPRTRPPCQPSSPIGALATVNALPGAAVDRSDRGPPSDEWGCVRFRPFACAWRPFGVITSRSGLRVAGSGRVRRFSGRRPGAGPAARGGEAGQRRRDAHLHLDDRLPPLQPAHHQPASRARRDRRGAGARCGLAGDGLPGRGERGQVGGGLRAVPCGDGGAEVQERDEHAEQHGDGGGGPDGGDAAVAVVSGVVCAVVVGAITPAAVGPTAAAHAPVGVTAVEFGTAVPLRCAGRPGRHGDLDRGGPPAGSDGRAAPGSSRSGAAVPGGAVPGGAVPGGAVPGDGAHGAAPGSRTATVRLETRTGSHRTGAAVTSAVASSPRTVSVIRAPAGASAAATARPRSGSPRAASRASSRAASVHRIAAPTAAIAPTASAVTTTRAPSAIAASTVTAPRSPPRGARRRPLRRWSRALAARAG